MIRVLCILLAFAISTGAATAETLRVLAGDHIAFVRVVFDGAASRGGWTVEKSGRVVEVSSGNADLSFDISSLFDRIADDLLHSAQDMGGGKLRLELACDCDIVTVPWRETGLYIDISEAPDVAAATSSAVPAASGFSLPLFLPRSTDMPLSAAAASPAPTSDSSDPSPLDASALERNLTAAVSGAIDQGFLIADALQPPPPDLAPDDQSLELGFALQTHTASRSGDTTKLVSECVDPNWVALPGWVTNDDFSSEIAQRRMELVGATGIISGNAVLTLARSYAAHGMGLEARAALQIDGISSRERDTLVEIAQLVEGSQQPYPILSQQVGCDGFAGLLGYVAAETPPALSNDELLDIVAVTNQWPLADRHPHILSALWNRLGAQGIDAATGLIPDPGTVAQREPFGSVAGLQTLLQDAGALAPADQQDVIDLTDSLRYEARGTHAADPIIMSQLKALLDLHHYDEAAALLQQAGGSPEGERLAKEQFLTRVVAEGADNDFLAISFSWSPYGHDAGVRRQFSARLGMLGFADRAALWHPDAKAFQPILESAPRASAARPTVTPDQPAQSARIVGQAALARSEALRSDLTTTLQSN